MNRRKFLTTFGGVGALTAVAKAWGDTPSPVPWVSVNNSSAVTSCGPGNLPAWVPQPGNWAAVSLNAMSDVGLGSVGPNAGLAWTSAYYRVWATATYAPTLGNFGSIIVTADGGHNSYNGSDVYRYDVADRVWTRFKESYDGVGDGYSNSFGELPDGSIIPPHSYDGPEWTAFGADGGTLGSIFVPWTYTDFNFITATPYGHYLDLETKNWVRGSATGDEGRHSCGAVDPATNRYYYHGGDGASRSLRSWPMDATTAATTHSGRQLVDTDSVMAIDHVNRTLVILSLRNQGVYFYWDLDNIEAGSTKVTSGMGAGQGGSTLEFAPATNRYYSIRTRDRSVWYLDGNNLGAPFTQESDQGTRPIAPENNLYGKLRWVEHVRCFVGCTRASELVFAYRPIGS